MAAAAITTGVVMTRSIGPYSVKSGTTKRRLMEGWCEGTKVTAGDWVAATAFVGSAQTAQIVQVEATIRDTNRTLWDELITYNEDNGRILLGGATASAATAFVRVQWYTG